MSTYISNIENNDDMLIFDIKGVSPCVVNSLRRVIVSNIPTLVFRGFPHEENNIHIKKNYTKFNNEYLKHRISCIPIMNDDETSYTNYMNSYMVYLHVINDSAEQKQITTKDLKIIYKETKKEMDEAEVRKLFPPDPITGDYSIICILYPSYNKNEKNEELELEIHFDIGTPQENSCWNIVHNCCYEYLQNKSKIEEEASKIEDEFEKTDFKILNGQKIYFKDEFKMTVQSLGENLGIFTNTLFVYKSCDYIINKLSKIIEYMTNTSNQDILSKNEFMANITDGTSSRELLDSYENMYCSLYSENDDFYVLKIKEDDFTIGKLIEQYLYKLYESELAFVGFKKEHPSKPEAYIYIKFHSKTKSQNIKLYISETIKQLIEIYKNIQTYFTKKK